MIDEKTKKEIDDMDYERMLSLWRSSPIGHPMFQGKVGEYYSKVMAEKRKKVGNAEHIRISKLLGWGI